MWFPLRSQPKSRTVRTADNTRGRVQTRILLDRSVMIAGKSMTGKLSVTTGGARKRALLDNLGFFDFETSPKGFRSRSTSQSSTTGNVSD